MLVYYGDAHRSHDPQAFLVRGRMAASAEQPERADRLLAAAAAAGHRILAPSPVERQQLAAVHTAEYLDFLENGPGEWAALPGAGPEILANVHPNRHMAHRPRHIVGRAGWHMADTACPVGPGTFAGASASAAAAVDATRAVLAGTRQAYALCRPPGHHAYADMAGGFCFLNNVAIAAALARQRHDRVAILDIDVHHGNGTQGIFYARSDVLTVSLHADPADYYPFFAGYADERGDGDGLGANLNLPLPHGTGDADYLVALEEAFRSLRAFGPGILLVALGLDAAENDPLGALKITRAGFAEIARRIAGLALPTVLVQEGGYLSDDLGPNLAAFLGGF